MTPLSHFVRYRLPALAWALLIFLGSSIPSSKFPNLKIFDFDKLIHITIFFVFGLLVYRASTPRNGGTVFRWKRALIAIGVVVLYGAFDEIHQSFVPGRSLDKWDLLADSIGGCFAAIVIFARHRKKLQ